MWGTDFSRKRASLGGMTQPMEKYIWGVRQSNSLGGSSDAARCCQHRSNWFNYTHCQACGDDEQCRINANRGPWQLFAQAHARQRPITASHSSRHDMLAIIYIPLSIRPIFIFCCRSYVKLLDYGPLRPEARGIRRICHMVNPALTMRGSFREFTGRGKCPDAEPSLLLGVVCTKPQSERQDSRAQHAAVARSCSQQTDVPSHVVIHRV